MMEGERESDSENRGIERERENGMTERENR